MPHHTLLAIITLEEVDDRTRIISKSVFESVEDRDEMMISGMTESGSETLDRLAELVEGKTAALPRETPVASVR